MPKHTWTVNVKGDNGRGPNLTVDIYFSAEANVGGITATQTGLQVGVQDVEEVDSLAIDVSAIKSFYMKCDTDVKVRTNSWVSPAQEFDFDAGEGLAWNDQNIPFAIANPLTVDITKLYIFNKGTVNGSTPLVGGIATPKVGSFIASFGAGEESQFS